MYSLLLAVALAAQPQTVTFTHPCAHSSVVLKALGKELGVKMAPGGSVLQDYFAVKFTERDPETIKRLIAETLNAVWVQRGEYLVLDRGPVQHAAELKEQNDALRPQIERFLNERAGKTFDIGKLRTKAVEAIGKQSNPDAYSKAMMDVRNLMPDVFLGADLVNAVGVDQLLATEPGSETTYTWRSSGESSFPPALGSHIERYVKRVREVAELFSIVGLESSASFGVVAAGGELTIRASITRDARHLGVRLEEETRSPTSSAKWYRHLAAFYLDVYRPEHLNLPLKGELVVEEDLAALVEVLRFKAKSQVTGDVAIPGPSTWDAAIRAGTGLDQRDITGLTGEVPLRQACDQLGRDYVALIPDESAFDARWIAQDYHEDLASVWRSWCGSLNVSEDSVSKAILARPINPRSARYERFDRQATIAYIKQFESARKVTLDSLAGFARRMPDRDAFWRSEMRARAFLPVDSPLIGDYFALTILGLLTAEQRRAASSEGVIIGLDHLPPGLRTSVAQELMRSNRSYSEQPPESSGFTLGQVFRGNNPPEIKKLESLPSDIELKVTIAKARLLRPKTSRFVFTSPMTSKEIVEGIQHYRPESGLEFGQIAVVDVERVNVQMFVPGHGYCGFFAQTDGLTLETKFSAPTQLPQPFRSEIQDALRGGGLE